mmetsp:Transcript_12339/g.10642  ORF Transcript_12339/g.10642 Transcript_12339/m.10642 type:complete len:119 (-) Transcript_12339:172-528(-)|eukprot:CAMPEP_0114588442 /NCGR_PEP_ID=MMETSP0125-20121206/11142_1 /TAXON_ID=485358 ORGANISM="Aristerostoma sp., Strain ATCC 50986" /NCGR_SAMPLE_ID=MMETSP0125 /ASSEMBLY_ACC=CAM_ASM_000245 /LENGTH=118 /DNA_ID=CAMNT_0001784837 /DNA_START=810 /DNA_END=1166 /DNA_ORIENTATION=-
MSNMQKRLHPKAFSMTNRSLKKIKEKNRDKKLNSQVTVLPHVIKGLKPGEEWEPIEAGCEEFMKIIENSKVILQMEISEKQWPVALNILDRVHWNRVKYIQNLKKNRPHYKKLYEELA